MSILEKMSERQALQQLLAERGPEIEEMIRVKAMTLKPKRPRINKILGDANPLASEEMQALKEFAKISRREVE